MNPILRITLSAIIAAIIASGGAFFGVATELERGSDIGDIRMITWLVIAVTALVAAAKDIKTYLAPAPEQPPTDTK